MTFAWSTDAFTSFPAQAFTSRLAVVYISSSNISNNAYHYHDTEFPVVSVIWGVAISAQTRWIGLDSNTYWNNTYFNQIVVSNSTISNNSADGNGGAISLQGTSIRLISTNIEGNVADFNNMTSNWEEWNAMGPCSTSEYNYYYGGGAIYASSYSLVEILNSSSITFNRVIPYSIKQEQELYSVSFMSGGIFCCPGFNVTVVLDDTSNIANNNAPLVNDISCHNSTFHKKIPNCNFVGPDASICEYGPVAPLPIALIAVGTALVVGIIALVYIKRRGRHHYDTIQ